MTAPTTPDLADRIRLQLDAMGQQACEDPNAAVRGFVGLSDTIRTVLDVHRPLRIYDDCGHQPHEYAEDGSVPAGMVEIEGVGLVCEEGYQFSICSECCTGMDGYQSQHCESEHDHLGVQVAMATNGRWVARPPCYPCGTVRAISEQLGVAS